MKKTRAKHLSKVSCWAFIVCAAAVAVLAVIKGQYAFAVWPILAALFYWLATTFQGLAEDAIDYGGAMMMANLEQSRELCDAQLKILELENEIEQLKNGNKEENTGE